MLTERTSKAALWNCWVAETDALCEKRKVKRWTGVLTGLEPWGNYLGFLPVFVIVEPVKCTSNVLEKRLLGYCSLTMLLGIFCPLTLHERIYCINAMFGIVASVLSWQQWCYQQPKEVQYHCHPVKAFFHKLTLDYFSLEDVLPTIIICDWCIGWGWKVDKSICLEIRFCRMLSFSKLLVFSSRRWMYKNQS